MTSAIVSSSAFPIAQGFGALQLLWAGSSWQVFAALELATQKRVLIKTERFAGTSRAFEGPLRRDYAYASRLGPSCALWPAAISEGHGSPLFVYEDAGFRPLADKLNTVRFSADTCLQFAVSLGQCVKHCHDHHILIGGLSPQTLWVHPETGQPKIADFSYASEFQQSYHVESLQGDDVRYVAPEQTGRVDQLCDQRSDLYLVGLLLYEFAVGHPAFAGGDPIAVLHGHIARVVPLLITERPDLPEAYAHIVAKLLAKSPIERYQSATGLLADLGECATQWRAHGSVQSFQLGRSDPRSVFTLSARLFSRELELEELSRAFDQIPISRLRAVLVRGEPGVGKSALVKYFWRTVIRGRARLLSAKFDQFGNNAPYAVLIQLVGDLINQILTEPASVFDEWRTRISGALGANARLLVDLVPVTQRLFGELPALPELPAVEARTRIQRVINAFVRCLSQGERPCILFVDDLQWGDVASIELLGLLVDDPSIDNILIVGAYRPSEVPDDHPLAILLAERPQLKENQITLRGLQVTGIAAWLADSLAMPREKVWPLAELTCEKTEGNPFFVAQLISFLQQQHLIGFDYDVGEWRWDLRRIHAHGLTDNILELMTRKLTVFPVTTCDVLRVGACLGGVFDSGKVGIVLGLSAQQVREASDPALRHGLLITEGTPQTAVLRFVHDRVQQAAFRLTPADAIEQLHLNIATTLLSALPSDCMTNVPLEIVDNFNSARRLIDNPAQRTRLAGFNLEAGLRAREATAFAIAASYLDIGIELLPDARWTAHYELTYRLYSESFECAYVTGRTEHAALRFTDVVAHASSRLEVAKAIYTKVLLDTAVARSDEAVSVGCAALHLFGEELPTSPSKLRLLAELVQTRYRLSGRTIMDLERLPPLKDADQKAAMSLLMSICPAAYFCNPDLMSVAALRIVRKSLQYGNSSASSFGYVLYGLIQGAVLGNYQRGHEFGQLAVSFARRDSDVVLRCKILLIFAGFVNFWRKPIDTSLDLLEESFRMAYDCGDIQYANYSVLQSLFLKLARGRPLSEVAADCERFQDFVVQTKDKFAIENVCLRKQMVRALQGKTRTGVSLSDNEFDERLASAAYAFTGNLTTQSYYYVLKQQLAYLFGEYQLALEYGDRAHRQISAVLSQITSNEHYFYRGLNLAAAVRHKVREVRRTHRQLRVCERKLATWACSCPVNFNQQHTLLQAEIASLRSRDALAEKLYDRAIRQAQENGFLHVEAIANELAAQHYIDQGRLAIAGSYLESARNAYEKWGATAKVHQLDEFVQSSRGLSWPERLMSSQATVERPDPGSRNRDSVLRASTAISVEFEADRALSRLLRVLLETVGAQNAMLLINNKGDPHIEAVVMVEAGGDTIERFTAEQARNLQFSRMVARYVLRTGEQVLIERAQNDTRFDQCEYLADYNPQALLCMPLTRNGKVIGALYTENRLVATAFPAELSTSLNVIRQQVALVLENAAYAQSLRDQEVTLQAAQQEVASLESIRIHLSKFVPHTLKTLIETNPLAPELQPCDRDLTVMFLDIAGYTRLSLRLSREDVQLLVETYFSAFVDDIYRYGGDISEILGDGLLVLFQHDAPSQHAGNAIECAKAIRATTNKVNQDFHQRWGKVVVNVGICSGVVRLGPKKIESASGIRWTYGATGSVTNLAARIGESARRGALIVSEETARRVHDPAGLKNLGPQSYKGWGESVEVFQVL